MRKNLCRCGPARAPVRTVKNQSADPGQPEYQPKTDLPARATRENATRIFN